MSQHLLYQGLPLPTSGNPGAPVGEMGPERRACPAVCRRQCWDPGAGLGGDAAGGWAPSRSLVLGQRLVGWGCCWQRPCCSGGPRGPLTGPVHVFVSRDDVFLTKTWDPDTKEFENLVSVILGLPCHLCLLSFIKVKKEGICEVLAHMFLYGF